MAIAATGCAARSLRPASSRSTQHGHEQRQQVRQRRWQWRWRWRWRPPGELVAEQQLQWLEPEARPRLAAGRRHWMHPTPKRPPPRLWPVATTRRPRRSRCHCHRYCFCYRRRRCRCCRRHLLHLLRRQSRRQRWPATCASHQPQKNGCAWVWAALSQEPPRLAASGSDSSSKTAKTAKQARAARAQSALRGTGPRSLRRARRTQPARVRRPQTRSST